MKKTKREYKQGTFTALHPKKYKGTHPIVYRSSLELNCMRWFDSCPNVIEWGSETVIIPYVKPTDGKVHRYYTDFNVKIVDKKGIVRKYIIEVKPFKQTIPPTKHGNKKPKTLLYEQVNYAINCAKWDAAREWCGKHGYIFSHITEKDINNFIK
jgi:hypothetical protein